MLELYKYTDKELDALVKSMIILVDTREHDGKNENILGYFDKAGIPYKKKKLDYGDYSFYIPANEELNIPRDLYFDKKCIIERKNSLEEISGNLTKDRARFEKELSLAPKYKCIVIENASYADMINGNYDTNYNNKSFWASYHSIWMKYAVPLIFMPDNKYTGFFIRGFFTYYFKNHLR